MQQLELMLRDGRSVVRLMDQAMGSEGIVNDISADRMLDDMVRATARQGSLSTRQSFRKGKARPNCCKRNFKERLQAGTKR